MRGEGGLSESFKPDALGISKAVSHWAAPVFRAGGLISVSSSSQLQPSPLAWQLPETHIPLLLAGFSGVALESACPEGKSLYVTLSDSPSCQNAHP